MESKYTKAERRKIYLKAADIITDVPARFNSYCCNVLKDLGGCKDSEVLVIFPEFELFNPGYYCWFDDPNPDTAKDRIICLLLCAEICND